MKYAFLCKGKKKLNILDLAFGKADLPRNIVLPSLRSRKNNCVDVSYKVLYVVFQKLAKSKATVDF